MLAASTTVSRDKLDKFLKKDRVLEFPKEGTTEGTMAEQKGNWVRDIHEWVREVGGGRQRVGEAPEERTYRVWGYRNQLQVL